MTYRRTIFFTQLILLVLTGCQNTSHEEYSISQFIKTTSIRGSSFSPDESEILFSSDETGVFNAYTISVNGGKTTALTTSIGN